MTKDIGTFQREETVPIGADFKLASGAYADPTTHIKCTVKDPAGTAVVNAEAMSKDNSDTGRYHHYYLTTSASLSGKYKGYSEAKSGTYVQREPFTFTVEVV